MGTISLIAALDEAGGIGLNNQLLAHLPADLAYFKSVTLGKPIIMGRRTYESIGRPLPGRENIIISSQLTSIPGAILFNSLIKAFDYTKPTHEVMVIGGAQLFNEAIEWANQLYITKIHHQFKADVFFPVLHYEQWQCLEQNTRARDERNAYDLTFYTYRRIKQPVI